MATYLKKDWIDLYNGFTEKDVGLTTIEPTIYYSKGYQKKKAKKLKKLFIGGINRIIYSGYEHDKEPLVLAMSYEPVYNTIIGYNLHYIPVTYRQKIIQLVLKSNIARIKKQLPLIIDYQMIKKAVPESLGAVRRYKVIGIRVDEAIPLTEWKETIKENSKWSNYYKNARKS